MRLRVLGCSGGIGDGHRTTSFLVDDDVLIDGGTGVGDLAVAELARIDHVFITHSHLDHIASIPLLLDTVGSRRTRPVTLHALEATIDVLRAHVFNWLLWPDFTQIPTADRPQMRYRPVAVGQRVDLDGRGFQALPANHVVPACGYLLVSEQTALAFTGDTAECDAFWDHLSRVTNLRYLIIETAYRNADNRLADAAKHMTPAALARSVAKLHARPEVLITHLKPGEGAQTMAELHAQVLHHQVRALRQGEVLEF